MPAMGVKTAASVMLGNSYVNLVVAFGADYRRHVASAGRVRQPTGHRTLGSKRSIPREWKSTALNIRIRAAYRILVLGQPALMLAVQAGQCRTRADILNRPGFRGGQWV